MLLQVLWFTPYLRSGNLALSEDKEYTVSGEAAEEYSMPKKDGDLGEKTVGNPLLFYDMGGKTGNAPGYYAGMIRFVPSREGEQIILTFDELNLGGAAKVYIYDEPVSFTAYSSPVPDGYVAVLSGEQRGMTFQSASGGLSVLYHSKGSATGNGWTASVSAIVPKEMEFGGCTSAQTFIGSTYPGKQAQPLLRINVLTDGSNNALTLDELEYDLAGTTALTDIANPSLYYTGSSETFHTESKLASLSDNPQQGLFAVSQTLRSGNNYFWITADVKADAIPMHKLDAACTSVKIGGTSHPCQNDDAQGNINIDNVALLSAVHQTYTVGTDPVSFYDDGGKEGNISEKFSGSVTFIPSTPGNKILVRFEKLDLFNTSSIGLNDLLRVYAGHGTDEEQLLETVLKEPVTVKSTAVDGSLTISLVSTTGIPKPGFEAVIEEFTPQGMTVGEIRTAHPLNTTLSSGTTGEQILSLNIRTEHTEPALTARKFVFAAPDCFMHIARATLYYTGKDNTFATKVKAGEVTVENGRFEIPAAIGLSEGNNFFWLTYDLNAYVPNGTRMDAEALSVTLSEQNRTIENGNPEGDRIVENKFVSKVGTATETVTGTWLYTHNPNGDRYVAEMGDQIVTFMPATEGKIMEIDFLDFDVYYSSGSYGVKAKYQIYSGAGTTGDLLWELKSADDKNVGPGKVLRSNAADGAITVVFDAKDTGSSYTAKGWHAEVREYESMPMELASVQAFQATTDIIKPSATDQQILGIRVQTTGDLQPLTLDALQISLKGCSDIVEKVSVYYTAKKNEFAIIRKVGELTAPEETALIPFDEPVTLEEASSYYWIAYDMKPGAAAERAVDAALLSVKTGDKTVAVKEGDPEGARLTKNILELQQGDNGIVTVGGSLMFYDDGGADNKYSKSMDSKITFVPADPDNIIRLVFRSFVTNSNDEMKLYHGNAVLSVHSAKYYGNLGGKLPEPFVSTAADGTVTVAFKSYSYSTPTAGWEIEVQEYSPQPLSLGDVRVIPQTDRLLAGMTGEPLLKLEVNVAGDRGSFRLEEFGFEAPGATLTAVSRAQLFMTDTINNFGPAERFGTVASEAPYRFAGSKEITLPGTYNFWLAYDIAASARENDLVAARLSDIRINGEVVQVETPAVSVAVSSGVSGNFRIGTSASADYAALSQAVTAIANGISGPVVLEIEPGTYSGQVVIPHIPGASEVNTITVRSVSGNYNDVVFATDTYTEPPYGEEKNGMFTIYGTDYITLEGIKFTSDASWPSLLNIKNISRNVTVRNCCLSAGTWSEYSGGSKLAYMEAANRSNHNNDFVTFESCLFEGGTYGVYVNGTGYVALQKQQGGRVVNNTFKNQGMCAIYVTKEEDALIEGNTIENTLSAANNFKAIDAVAMEGMMIRNNIITLATQSHVSGIYLRKRDANNQSVRRTRIYNNEINIRDINGTSNSYGINCTDELAYTDIVYNTIRFARENGSGKGAGVYFYATASKVPVDVIFRNNIVQNLAQGVACHITNASVFGSGATLFAGNALHTNGTVLAYGGSDIADIAAWAAATGDETSVDTEVEFIAPEILEPAEGASLKFATPLEYVTTDIKGQERHASTPTVGAYEYTGISDVPAMKEGYPFIGNISHDNAALILKADNDGKAYLLSLSADAEIPSVSDVIARGVSSVIRKENEHTLQVGDLDPLSRYTVYVVLQSMRGVNSAVIASDEFETGYLPTVVSDFENAVAPGDGAFTDGTASFDGFTVVDITDGVGTSNRKAARFESAASVTLTNSPSGLTVTGFYLKSDSPVTLEVYQGDELKGSQSVSATPQWHFVNLRNQGELTTVMLMSEGEAWIDNFSGQPQALEVLVEDQTAGEGERVTVRPTVAGGVSPYSYEWKNAANETLDSEAEFVFEPLHTGKYTITVTDAWGNASQAVAVVKVTGSAYTATFDDLYLADESHWGGDMDSKEFMVESEFYSGSYAFNNVCMPSYSSWAFWGYSNETSTSYGGLSDQFRSAVGSGVNGSANYAVAFADSYMGIMKVKVTHQTAGDSIQGCYISNTAWVKDAIVNGDGMSNQPGGFMQNDSLVLTIIGKNGSQETGSINLLLADYRATQEADHYYLDTWQWADLRALGKVTELAFRMSGSKTNSFGMTTPAYFCMDDFNGTRPETAVEEVRIPWGEAFLKVSDYFTFDPQEATVAYTLPDKSESDVVTVSVLNDYLNLDALKDGSTDIVVCATQKGKKEFARIPVTVDNTLGLDDTEVSQTTVEFKQGTLYVYTSLRGYTVDLVAANGVSVRFGNLYNGSARIDLSAINGGVYIVRINSREGSFVKKIVIR